MGFDLPLMGKAVVEVTRDSETPDQEPNEKVAVDCYMGETVGTMEGIKKHCQFQMESNQTPFTQAARGLQRKHMKNQGSSHHVLNVDLTGPHTPACGHIFCVWTSWSLFC